MTQTQHCVEPKHVNAPPFDINKDDHDLTVEVVGDHGLTRLKFTLTANKNNHPRLEMTYHPESDDLRDTDKDGPDELVSVIQGTKNIVLFLIGCVDVISGMSKEFHVSHNIGQLNTSIMVGQTDAAVNLIVFWFTHTYNNKGIREAHFSIPQSILEQIIPTLDDMICLLR